MSWIDSRWQLWDAQALTVTEESRTNGDFFDMEEGGATDDSISDLLWFNFQVTTVFATLTQGCFVAVITSDAVDFTSNVKCLAAIGCEDYPILVGELTAGAGWSVAFPYHTLHKYVECVFVAVSTAAGSGNADAWFGLEPLNNKLNIQKEPT